MAGTASTNILRVALATMILTQALLVMATLALPVIAPLAANSLNLPAQTIGLYTSLVFGGAMIAALGCAGPIDRWGAVRTSQVSLLLAALGLIVLLGQTWWCVAASALLIGFAYGPANPAGSMLLAELTPPGRRSAVFSIKQTSVPAGGAAAGLLVPAIAQSIDWQTAVMTVAVLCLATILLVQPVRAKLDGIRRTRPPVIRRRRSRTARDPCARSGNPDLRARRTLLCGAATLLLNGVRDLSGRSRQC